MRYKFTLLNILLFFAFTSGAQTIKGIWRGYFAQSSFGFYDERYKFEVQIDQAANNALHGVTYSYKTTVFYGKANVQGIYTPKTNNVILNELDLVELKIDGQSSACLMTCYLEYARMGNLETLTGTYTSRFLKGKGDCGEGKVYLERTTTSDFEKEDFLLKEDDNLKNTPEPGNNVAPKPNKPLTKARPKVVVKPSVKSPALAARKPIAKKPLPGKSNSATAKITKPNPANKAGKVLGTPKPATTATIFKPRLKPGAEGAVTKNDKPKASAIENFSPPPVKEDLAKPKEEFIKPRPVQIPKPEILKRRSNELVKTIFTAAHEIKIELYDNGEIDGDTISVYHNNQLIISKKRLTDKPITFNIKIDENDANHEFVMVAENLGLIPPNTALMVITAGEKRYELFVISTEQKNAVVNLEYRAANNP